MKKSVIMSFIALLAVSESCLAPGPSQAQTQTQAQTQAIGQVIFTSGTVQAIEGTAKPRDLVRRSDIYKEDTIKTAEKSMVKIRFADDTLLSLNPNTEFQVVQYQYSKTSPEKNEYLSKLIKGGFLVITGSVANENKANFQVNSELLGLTVRGTCFGGSINAQAEFAGVACGTVEVTNKFGTAWIGEHGLTRFAVAGRDGSLMTYHSKEEAQQRAQCYFPE